MLPTAQGSPNPGQTSGDVQVHRRKGGRGAGRPPAALWGQRFGSLTVEAQWYSDHKGRAWWYCKCDCGGDKFANTDALRRGWVTSCGCLRRSDPAGTQYGRLTVLQEWGRARNGAGLQRMWMCKCECGGRRLVTTAGLKWTKSCGSCK